MAFSECKTFFMKTITCSDRVYVDEFLPEDPESGISAGLQRISWIRVVRMEAE